MFARKRSFLIRLSLYGGEGFVYNKNVAFLKKIKRISRRLSAFFAASLFFLSLYSPVFAGDGLGPLIEEALSNNRDIQAAVQRLEAMRYRIAQSSALPDPTAGTAYMGEMLETRLGPQENVYEFEQMIPFPGKLIEKRRIAVAEKNASEFNLAKTKRDVVLKVSQVYADLYATDKTLQTVNEVLELLKKFEAIAQDRYASQGGSQRDVAKAQSEVSEALKRIFILQQQKSTQEAMLSNLLNRRTGEGVSNLILPSLPENVPAVDELLDLSRNNRPELSEAQSFLQKSRHENALSKYENAPDFSVGFKYIEIGNGSTTNPDDGRDAWMIPVKVTLPLWQNRIGSAIAESQRNLDTAQARLEQEENTAVYEVKDAYYRYASSQKIVQLYENALLPEAELAFRSDRAGYEAGKTDILNLIDSERVYLDSRIAYHQARADAFKNFALLERAVGAELASGKQTGETK